jgi:hypothetical protein
MGVVYSSEGSGGLFVVDYRASVGRGQRQGDGGDERAEGKQSQAEPELDQRADDSLCFASFEVRFYDT